MCYDVTSNVKHVLRGGSEESDSEEESSEINTSIKKVIEKILKSSKKPLDSETKSDVILSKQDGIEYLDESDIVNSNTFKKLDMSDKATVLHKLKFYIPKKPKKIYEPVSTDNIDESKVYFVCTNCGNYEEIIPGTVIYNKNIHAQFEEIDLKKCSLNAFNRILPRTRNSTCPNDKCKSHKDPTLKEEVIKRYDGISSIIHTCVECHYSWSS